MKPGSSCRRIMQRIASASPIIIFGEICLFNLTEKAFGMKKLPADPRLFLAAVFFQFLQPCGGGPPHFAVVEIQKLFYA